MRILQICHNLVPRTMRRSHCLKSFLTHWKNLSGKFSPKKTMSGLTTPPHLGRVHRGTYIGNKCLEEEQSINVNLGLVFLHQDSLFDPGLNKFITIPDSIKKVFLCNSALCFSLHFWSNLTILLPTVDAMSSIEGTMCLDKLLITNACLKFEHDKLGGKHHITSLSKVSIFWV